MAIALSIVIPTYNRSGILQRTLTALASQEGLSAACEVIVVDDGSTDDTPEAVSVLAPALPMPLRYVAQPNRGPGAARNSGLRLAAGDLVLFLDSDIAAAPELLAGHLTAHRAWPTREVAVLGRVVLAPDIPATPLNLNHLVHRWHGLSDGQELPWHTFITCNISMKRSFLLDYGLFFDEQLRTPAYDDTELGYRAWKRGLRIRYCAQAAGYHNHSLDFAGALRMNRNYGEALAVLHHKYPELRHELGEYVLFSWGNAPRRVLHDLLRPLFLNRLTVSGLMHLINWQRRRGGSVPYALTRKIGAYYEREGYRRTTWELEQT